MKSQQNKIELVTRPGQFATQVYLPACISIFGAIRGAGQMFYLFLCVLLEGDESDIPEESLEDRGSDVWPVEHAVELGLVQHVLLKSRHENLCGIDWLNILKK